MVGLFGPTADDADRDYFQTWKNHALSGTLPVQISVCKFFFRRLAAPTAGAAEERFADSCDDRKTARLFCPPAAIREGLAREAACNLTSGKMIKGDILYAFYETQEFPHTKKREIARLDVLGASSTGNRLVRLPFQ